MMNKSQQEQIEAFRNSYAEMFGEVPPLPKAKFEFSSDIAPEALLLIEQLRARAFYNDVFDMKITQLILFAMLLVEGARAAKFHALAARKAGATWSELHTVMELATVVSALEPANKGSALLNELRKSEANS